MKSPDNIKITLTTAPDVREQLEAWARSNLTNLSAEMVRSVRERALHERKREQGAR
jgi:hypothetical protein